MGQRLSPELIGAESRDTIALLAEAIEKFSMSRGETASKDVVKIESSVSVKIICRRMIEFRHRCRLTE